MCLSLAFLMSAVNHLVIGSIETKGVANLVYISGYFMIIKQ